MLEIKDYVAVITGRGGVFCPRRLAAGLEGLKGYYLESISKIGFWFKIPTSPKGFDGTRAAGQSFPALLDSPSDLIHLVGRKPEAYCCMLRI